MPCRAVWTEAVLGIGVGDAIHWASFHASQLTRRQEARRERLAVHTEQFSLWMSPSLQWAPGVRIAAGQSSETGCLLGWVRALSYSRALSWGVA